MAAREQIQGVPGPASRQSAQELRHKQMQIQDVPGPAPRQRAQELRRKQMQIQDMLLAVAESKKVGDKGSIFSKENMLAAAGDIGSLAAFASESVAPVGMVTSVISKIIDKYDSKKHIKTVLLDNAIHAYINYLSFLTWLADNTPRCADMTNISKFSILLDQLKQNIKHLSSLSMFRDTAEKVATEAVKKYWGDNTLEMKVPGRNKEILVGIDAVTVLKYIKTFIGKQKLKEVSKFIVDTYEHYELRYQMLKGEYNPSLFVAMATIANYLQRALSHFLRTAAMSETQKELLTNMQQSLINLEVAFTAKDVDETEMSDLQEFIMSIHLIYLFTNHIATKKDTDKEIEKFYPNMKIEESSDLKAFGNFFRQKLDQIIDDINENIINLNQYQQSILLDIDISYSSKPCVDRKISIKPIFVASRRGLGSYMPIKEDAIDKVADARAHSHTQQMDLKWTTFDSARTRAQQQSARTRAQQQSARARARAQQQSARARARAQKPSARARAQKPSA